MAKFLSIRQASDLFGVSTQTLRRWEKNKKIQPSHRTPGGQRRYNPAKLHPQVGINIVQNRPTLIYARVSSHDQKEDLQRQINMLEMYCSARGWSFVTIKDLDSGMNYHKKGLKKLLEQIMNGSISRLVLTHKTACCDLELNLSFPCV